MKISHHGQPNHIAKRRDYQPRRGPLLTHVNLKINPGEFVYLIGKSGAGKTSLLRTLYADREIESGEAQCAASTSCISSAAKSPCCAAA